MKKIIYITIIFLLILNFTFAQNYPYFSIKAVPSGLMIGVEVINQKSNTVLDPANYNYNWRLPDISLLFQKTFANTFFISLNKYLKTLFIDVQLYKQFSNENYIFENNKLNLPIPQIKIVKQNNSVLTPIVWKLNKNDILTIITKNFSSKNLSYVWEINGVFVSNDKNLNLRNLQVNNGTIRARAFGSLKWERAEDFITIQIE
jgi:hypothetical protein